MSNPIVTIIIPVYNRLDLLRPTLTSVVNQTYKDWVTYICDDGSTENVGAVLKPYSDDRIIHKPMQHEGIGSTRNRGIALVDTPYLIMLDSDDVWDAHFLERTITFLQANPNVDAVHSAQAVFDRDGNYVQRRTERLCSDNKSGEFENIPFILADGLKYFLTEPFGANNMSSLIIKTSHAKGVRAEEIAFMEDWDYLIKLGKKGLSVAYLDEVLCYYRTYERTIVPEKQIHSLQESIAMLKKHQFDQSWQRSIQNRIIGNLNEIIGFDYLLLNKRWHAAVSFSSSLSKRFSMRGIYGLFRCLVPGFVRLWLKRRTYVE